MWTRGEVAESSQLGRRSSEINRKSKEWSKFPEGIRCFQVQRGQGVQRLAWEKWVGTGTEEKITRELVESRRREVIGHSKWKLCVFGEDDYHWGSNSILLLKTGRIRGVRSNNVGCGQVKQFQYEP